MNFKENPIWPFHCNVHLLHIQTLTRKGSIHSVPQSLHSCDSRGSKERQQHGWRTGPPGQHLRGNYGLSSRKNIKESPVAILLSGDSFNLFLQYDSLQICGARERSWKDRETRLRAVFPHPSGGSMLSSHLLTGGTAATAEIPTDSK